MTTSPMFASHTFIALELDSYVNNNGVANYHRLQGVLPIEIFTLHMNLMNF